MNKLQVVAGKDYEEPEETPLLIPRPGTKEPSDWWLDNLEPGTIFLCKRKGSSEFMLSELCLQARTEKNMVHLITPSQTQPPFWADPKGFSRAFELIEILLTSEEFNAFQDKEKTKKLSKEESKKKKGANETKE